MRPAASALRPRAALLVCATLAGLALAALAAAPAARAQGLSVSADVPAGLTFANGDATDRVTGFVVDAAFPILLGAGISYFTGWSGVNRVTYGTVHALFDLPIYFIKLRGGLGIGRAWAHISGTGQTYDPAPVDELYVRGGLGLLPGMDVHVGVHSLQGEAEITTPGGGTLDVSATVWTVGMTLGF